MKKSETTGKATTEETEIAAGSIMADMSKNKQQKWYK